MAADFEFAKGSMVSIGETLKKTRENKGFTVDQVRKKTRIHSTVIYALEEGRCDEILTPTYVKSFLKKYADFLGLESQELVKEYAASHPQDEPTRNASYPGNSKTPDNTSRTIHAISVVLLSFAVLSLIIFLVRLFTISIATGPAKKVEPKRIKTAPISRSKERRTLPPPPEKKTVERPKTPTRPPATKKRSPLNLTVKVKEPVLVQIKKDGVVLFKRVLPKGSSESFVAEDRIELFLAKAEAIELILDGKSLGSPGRGVIKNLEITRSGIKIRN